MSIQYSNINTMSNINNNVWKINIVMQYSNTMANNTIILIFNNSNVCG